MGGVEKKKKNMKQVSLALVFGICLREKLSHQIFARQWHLCIKSLIPEIFIECTLKRNPFTTEIKAAC